MTETVNPIVAIIQVRMGSTRLPGKALLDIQGKPVLWHVVNRVSRVPSIRSLVVATSTHPSDDAVAHFCQKNELECFRGDLNDVLDRFYGAARRSGAKTVVRITGDCPLIDPAVTESIIQRFTAGGLDYACNTQPPTFPDGLDTEVMSFNALHKAWTEARLQSEREHVTPYIWKNPTIFRIENVAADCDCSSMRWTVDDEHDLDFMRALFGHFGDVEKILGWKEIKSLLEKNPEILQINAHSVRNEGYLRSILKDGEDMQ